MPKFSMNPEIEQVGKMAEWAALRVRELLDQGGQDPGVIVQIKREHELVMQQLKDLGNVLAAVKVNRNGVHPNDPEIIRVENIPGRRVPFDFMTEITINANELTERSGTITIDQSGPFVAVARACTFLSQLQAEFTDPDNPGTVLPFFGRSNGRFRPTHSMWDIMDGQLPADVSRIVAFPGTGDPSYASPSNHQPYRTMEFDGRLTYRAMSNSFPRSNISVPTPFWTTQINSPFELGALDFFGRSEVIEVRLTPTHVNNPPFGNLAGYAAGGVFPFLESGFDNHEGIADPLNLAVPVGGQDPVQRLPNGIFIVLLHGYRIIQPPGSVVNLGMV